MLGKRCRACGPAASWPRGWVDQQGCRGRLWREPVVGGMCSLSDARSIAQQASVVTLAPPSCSFPQAHDLPRVKLLPRRCESLADAYRVAPLACSPSAACPTPTSNQRVAPPAPLLSLSHVPLLLCPLPVKRHAECLSCASVEWSQPGSVQASRYHEQSMAIALSWWESPVGGWQRRYAALRLLPQALHHRCS